MIFKISYAAFSRVAIMVISMISLMISAKFYGAEGRGMIAGATALATLFSTIGGLSLGRVLVFEIRERKLQTNEFYKQCLATVLMICFMLTVIVLMVALLAYIYTPSIFGGIHKEYLIVSFLVTFSLLWIGYSGFVFSSIDKLNIQSSISLSVYLLYIAVAYILVTKLALGLLGFLVLMSLCSFAICIVEIVYLFHRLKPELVVRFDMAKALLINSLKVHIDTVGGILLTTSSLFLLNYLTTPVEVGLFQLAQKFATLIVIIPTITALQFNHEIASMGPNAAFMKHEKIVALVMLVVVLLCATLYYVSPYVVLTVTSSEFERSIDMLRWLLIGVIGSSFSILLGPQLTSRGYFIFISIMTIILGVFSFIISYIFIKNNGIWGAVKSYNIVYMIVLILCAFGYIFLRNKSKIISQ